LEARGQPASLSVSLPLSSLSSSWFLRLFLSWWRPEDGGEEIYWRPREGVESEKVKVILST
jgi:hypothetical protein